MKTYKRILSVLLCVVLTLTAAPLSGFVGIDLPSLFDFEADAASYSGTCGDNLTWTLDTETGVLNITGTGAMYNWNYDSDAPWLSYRTDIKTINIGNGVTTIGDFAFYWCFNLTSVIIPDNIITISDFSFYECENLTSVTIGNGVKVIGDCAFDFCNSLTSVSIGNSVTTIGDYAFRDCNGLTSVTIPDSVTSIGKGAFCDCSRLTSITIGNSVTTIGEYAFGHCDDLTSITVDLNNKKYSSDSYGVLFNKDKTTLIQYPIGNTRTNYAIPDSVTTISDEAFYYCTKLINITIPDSVTTIGYCAFIGCYNLTSITVDSNNKNYSSDSYGELFNKDKTTLIQYPIGNTRTSYTIPDSVTSIGFAAFEYCDSLTSVTIPDSVTTIGDGAFVYCDSLTDVYYTGTQEQWNNISIGSDNSPLTSATIHFKDVDYSGTCGDNLTWTLDTITGVLNITGTGAMYNWTDESPAPWYSYRDYIKTVNIGNGVTTISDCAFCYCTNLTSVSIPESVCCIGYSSFESCENLENIALPENLQYIYGFAFWKCSSLETVSIPASVEFIGGAVFADCYSLKTITVDSENQYYSSDDTGALYNKEKTTLYQYPIGNTAKTYNIASTVSVIDERVFACAEYLETVYIPVGVSSVGYAAFYDCKNLLDIYYDGTQIQWNEISIDDGNYSFDTATIHFKDVDYSGTCGNNLTWTLNTSTGVLNITGTGEMYNWSSSSSAPWYSYRNYIKTVNIGNGVTTIGDLAFYWCNITSVTIPDSVTIIGESAFISCQSLTSVTIGNGVTTIGNYAFYNCTNLTNVTIPDGVTTIGEYAFSNCESLTSVKIGNGVTSIGDYAFYECKSLTSVTIPDSVTTIGNSAFSWCKRLTSVTIPDSVTTIGDRAFQCCTSFTSITIPDSVTTIGDYAFECCTSLTSITVDDNNKYYSSDSNGVLFNKDKTEILQYPIGNTRKSYTIPGSVTIIGVAAFAYSDLTSITIGKSVTTIESWAFGHCDNFTSVTMPDNVTTIGGYAFYGCDSLTSVTIPDSVTNIGWSAFYYCQSLTIITIPDSVTSIDDMAFYGCDSLTDVYFTGTQEQWKKISIGSYNEDLTSATIHFKDVDYSGTCGDNVYWSLDTSTGVLNITGTGEMYNWSSSSSAPWYSYRSYIKSVNIGNSVTTIGDYAFALNQNLESITIPNSVTIIGNCAFFYCNSLRSVTIGDSVITIGYEAFYNCDSLTSVTIPDSVTTIGKEAFVACLDLTSITVDENNKNYSSDSYGVLFNKDKTTIIQYPAGNTRTSYTIPDSVTTIGYKAFYSCDSLTSITIPDSVTAIGGSAFSACDSLTSVTIGNSVTTIGDMAFADCYALTSVTIGNSVTTIGAWAFSYCDNLTSVTIPDSVTTIGYEAFYGCTSLTNVTIGNGVTTIGNAAFSNCDSLTSVTIPDSVTTIGNCAFEYCDSLTDVYYTGTQAQWNKISIGSYNTPLTSAAIHYNSTGPNSFIYSQAHVVGDYKNANADYAAKYFSAMAQPMDGTNGNPDLCVPGLSLGDNMVPQGVAYYEANNWLLISAYYNSGNTNTTRPSVIFALDMATGKMVGEYHIYKSEKDENGNEKPYTGHVGGIAVSDYNLYIAYGKKIAYVPLSDLENNWKLVIKGSVGFSDYLDQANVSYLSINDGVLLFGNFYYAYSSDYKKPAKDAKSVILMQRLRGNSSEEEWNSVRNPALTAVIKVPDSVDRIQGVVCRDNKFFISSSQGRDKSSTLYIADLSGSTLKNICKFQAPPMMEGLTFAGDHIYTVFESAAAFYREGLDGEGKSVNPTDVVWRLNYNEWLGIDDTPTVTGDVENKYVQYVHGGTTGYTYLNFKQNWFSSDSMNYNHNLATLASQYVMIGYADEVSYSSKPDLEKALKAIGMSDIEIVAQAGRDEINYFIASRKITVNSQEYDLVFVGLIGSYHAQWYSNFDPGKGAIHKGFLSAKQFVYSALTDYIKDKGLSKDSTKILITGHSRGAAASNLLAADLIKGGVFAKPENIYTYCFATPNSTTLPERNEQRFKRIFNIVNPEDFVTKVLPTAWGYGRYGTTYVLPSKTNTTSSLYSAYRTNMQHYYGAFTQGDTYRPYIGGEADTRLVVESMISSIDNVNEFYDKTLWVGILPMSAYDFFQNSLCHIVSKEASAADWANLAIIVEGTLVTPTAPDVFKNVLTYFLLNGTGLNPCFENAHKAETYCSYMMAMSETQIKQTRKGYLNTVNCPVDVEVIDKVTGEVVGRIVNNVVDEEIAAKENSIVMSVDGDSKSFWLPSDGDYEVKLIGNNEGTMDYTVAEIDPDLGEQERVNFFDVEITEGKEFTGDVPAYDFELEEYTLKTDSSEEIPDEKLDAESGEITITTSVEGDGYVTESFNVKSGDYVTVSAQPFVTAKFVKWVDSNGKTLSTDAEYSFVAKENTSIKAVFTTASGLSIKTPSTTTVNYGDTLILHADFGEVALPEGYSILWTVEGAGFNMAPADDGLTCNMTSVANGNATVKATLVDENGEAVLDAEGNEISDTQELKSIANFWQKIVSFFKNLFRINRIIPE